MSTGFSSTSGYVTTGPGSEERNRLVLNSFPDLVLVLDRDGCFLDVHSAPEVSLYRNPEDFLGKRMDEVLPADLADRALAAMQTLEKPGSTVAMEYEMPIGGQSRWYEARLSLCTEDIVLALVRDLTEHRRAEAEMERQRSMLTESQRIARLGTWEWNLETDVLYWSEETYRIFGVAPETFEPRIETFLAFVHPEDREFVSCSISNAIWAGDPYDLEHRIILSNGRERVIHEQGKVYLNEDGKPIRTLGTARDITDQKRAEERLKRANVRLEENAERLRRLTLELARVEQRERKKMAQLLHDHLQQLLVATEMNLSIIGKTVTDEKVKDYVREASTALGKGIRLSKSLTIELSPPVLHEGTLIEGIEWLGQKMEDSHGLHVTVNADDSLPDLDDDVRVLIFNSVKELLFNVLKHAGTKSAEVTLRRADETCIAVTVADNGRGFDARQTTASQGRDGGFGLFALRERMDFLGGRLTIESAPKRGSQVTMVIPIESVNDVPP